MTLQLINNILHLLNTKKILYFLIFSLVPASELKAQSIVNADFSKEIGTGTDLMFGGNNYGFSTKAICDAHKQAGFNVARYDAFINNIVPSTTIADYKNNVANVQDSKTWHWEKIDRDLSRLNSSGFKVLLIMDYCPLWLTYLQGQNKNNINAVPADWLIYEDIVKKVFQHVQSKVFAIEVWNEPDLGFDIDNSPYKDKIAAYLDLYDHTSTPIRAINKTILIGGPAAGNTYDTSLLVAMLNDPRVSRNFNFYSYHFYGFQKTGNITLLKKIAASKGKRNFPIIISEWNYSADFNHDPMNTDDLKTISFVGNTIINQYKETPFMSLLYCMDEFKNSESFYTMDKSGKMSPKVFVYKLLSVQLGLGKGKSTIFVTHETNGLNSVAFTNFAGKSGICMANSDIVDKLANINFTHTRMSGEKTVQLFEVNKTHSSDKPLEQIKVVFTNGCTTINKIALPANSVIGMLIL